MSKYTLMHKNIKVLDMILDDDVGVILKISEIYCKEHIPIGVLKIKETIDRKSLNDWYISRAIPASRIGLNDALEAMNVQNKNKLLESCYALSLSDQYWITPTDSKIKWEDVNFFENEFSEDVGEILFGKKKTKFSLVSPDNTSDGWLKKKWKIVDNKRILIKSGSGVLQQEPYNEVIASILAKKLGAYYAPYSLMYIDDKPYSVCENFVTTNTEFIAAFDFMKNEKKENHISIYKHYLNCAKKYEIEGMQEFLNRMIVLDYIMGNEDRHLGNFGVIRDVNKLKFIGPAPIFDTGTSLYLNTPTVLITNDTKIDCKPFKSNHKEQLKLVSSLNWIEFDKLETVAKEIEEVLSKSVYIDKERAKVIIKQIEYKIQELKQYAKIHKMQDDIQFDVKQDEKYCGN